MKDHISLWTPLTASDQSRAIGELKFKNKTKQNKTPQKTQYSSSWLDPLPWIDPWVIAGSAWPAGDGG